MNAPAATHSAAQVAEAAARLRALPPLFAPDEISRLVRALCQSGIHLLGADRALAQELRRELLSSTGLSAGMLEWALTTTFSSLRPDVLDGLAREVTGTPGLVPVPARLASVVLAGNIFSAAVRAIYLPLLSGAPVLVKTSSSDDVLPRFLLRALHAIDPDIAQRCELVSFGRDTPDALQALLADAEVVSIYGDDSSIQRIAAQAQPNTRVLRHGHGISASFVGADALRGGSTATRDAGQRVALDIAAYDQRGCLSPHVVFVEGDARSFARSLAETALPELARLLPPGAATLSDQALALQWRAAAQVRGELFEGRGYAVSYESNHAPRSSPGGRLISVYDCPAPDAAIQALRPFGSALKCIGVAGPRELRLELAQCLRPFSAARVCRAGEMQTPPFHAYADGQAPLFGLLAFSEAH
ncbi:MAG TPA: acyl-CoA reductase [Polyangiales bacterium]|nr:acyl-CoA reductase [Polyangiales bacterium]